MARSLRFHISVEVDVQGDRMACRKKIDMPEDYVERLQGVDSEEAIEDLRVKAMLKTEDMVNDLCGRLRDGR